MIDMFFAGLFSVLGFTFDLVLRGLIWGFTWLVLLIIAIVAYRICLAPVGWALSLSNRKYERLHKISNVIQDTDMLLMIGVWSIAIITVPLAIMAPATVTEQIDKHMTSGRNHEVVEHTEVRQYKLLDITNPKHVYVTLEDIKSGNTYRQYVSKHCSGENQLGDVYNLEVTYYHMSDDPATRHIRFHNLNRGFCN